MMGVLSSFSPFLDRSFIAPPALAWAARSSSSLPTVKLQFGKTFSKTEKRLKFLLKFVIMLLPPLLAGFLLKSTALLSTGSSFLSRGVSFLSSSGSQQNLSPIIMTLDGFVQGKIAKSRNGSPYWQYLSIPYAEPPVGPLRFQPPQPVKPWSEVRQGLKYPPGCVQFEPVALAQTSGIENCLYLNVNVPNRDDTTSEKSLKPVLIYIHGGAFVEGQSSSYQPDYLMDHNIIVVTFNYRLGPLGYLNFDEKNDTTGKYPRGNQGSKDQRAVMKWVQKNIEKFGGNPEKITLLADSAGAVSLNLHMLSPLSHGLFHRGIIISGSSLSPWGFTKKPRQIAFRYGSRLGCSQENVDSLLECYMNMDPHKMVSLQYAWSDPIHEKDQFVPSVEPLVTSDIFLTESPIDILENGRPIANVPLLAGVTSGEGGLRSGRFRAMPDSIPLLEENWETLIDKVLFLDEQLPRDVAQDVKQYYFADQGKSFSEDVPAFLERMTKLASDALFVGPVNRAATYHAKRGNPTYMFYYDYKPVAMLATFSAFSQVGIYDGMIERMTKLVTGIVSDWVREFVFGGKGAHIYGIGHAEDLFQIWNVNGVTKWLTGPDLDFSRGLIQTIVDFTTDMKPLTYRGVPWPTINAYVESTSSSVDNIPYMKLDNGRNPQIIWEPFRERLQFWETLRSTKYKNI